MITQKLLEWLASDDTGLSSRAILAHLTGDPVVAAMNKYHWDYPRDPSDFGRCVRLLDIEPSFRACIGEMANICPEWAALATHWGELEALYSEELAEGTGKSPRLYKRMRELIEGAKQRA